MKHECGTSAQGQSKESTDISEMPNDASETPSETSTTQTRRVMLAARNTSQSASLRNDKVHAINSDDSNPWKFPVNQADDNGDALFASLEALSEAQAATLKTAACIQSLDKTLLQAALKRNDDEISSDLDAAAKVGIITLKNDSEDEYVFANNDTMSLLYNLFIPVEEQSRQHVTIGRNLIQNLSREQLQEYYYTVLRQFKLGESSLTRQSERNAIATHCLEAGEYAVSNKGDFLLASLYLNFGISLLGRDCWKDEYDLTLALYNDAAEVEYSKSNYTRVDELVETVLTNARSFNDTLRARASRIYCLSSQYQMTEAVNESLYVLHHLGEHFPANPKRRHIGRELMRTWRLLKGKTNESILRIPVMTDPNKLATLQILNLLFPGAYRTRPKLWGLIIIRIVRLTLLYGLSPVSAVGFAFYAAISSMITKDVAGSYRYAEVALALVDKFRAKEFIPRVYLGVYGHTSSYKFFLRDMYPKLLHAHQVGLETGDTEV
jgi:predicted ATPase